MVDLSAKTAVVTGGAAGLGLVMARRLARSGAAVAEWATLAAGKDHD